MTDLRKSAEDFRTAAFHVIECYRKAIGSSVLVSDDLLKADEALRGALAAPEPEVDVPLKLPLRIHEWGRIVDADNRFADGPAQLEAIVSLANRSIDDEKEAKYLGIIMRKEARIMELEEQLANRSVPSGDGGRDSVEIASIKLRVESVRNAAIEPVGRFFADALIKDIEFLLRREVLAAQPREETK